MNRIQSIILNKYGEALKGLDIYENNSSLILSRIVVSDEYKNQGIGTQIMEDLVNYADKNTKIIALTPSSDFGGNKNRLIQFYKRFGFKMNKGVHKSFEFRDAMIRYPKLSESMSNEKIKGGLADRMSVEDIAKKHGLPVEDINKELDMGVKVEMEHVNDDKLSRDIALDHLVEIPDYYTRLKKMEDEAKVEESTQKKLIRRLFRESVDLSITDETPDSHTFDVYYNRRKAGHITCGPASSRVFGKDTHEIIELYLDDEYTTLNVANQAVQALWVAHPEVNRLIVSIPSKSHLFWEKLGFSRLNDNFHQLFRGH